MAKQTQKFKIDDVIHEKSKEMAIQFECIVCACILSEGVETECRHMFCRECLKDCGACPFCRHVFTKEAKLLATANPIVHRMLNSLQVRCPWRDGPPELDNANGKDGEGTGGSVCSSESKRRKVEKVSMVTSHKCDWEGQYADLLGSHLLSCLNTPVTCPRGCGVGYHRRNENEHSKKCASNFEICSICAQFVKPGKMNEHGDKQAKVHVGILMKKVELLTQQQQLEAKKADNVEYVKFTIRKWKDKLVAASKGTRIQSQRFTLGKTQGYCFDVYPKGMSCANDETHMAVFLSGPDQPRICATMTAKYKMLDTRKIQKVVFTYDNNMEGGMGSSQFLPYNCIENMDEFVLELELKSYRFSVELVAE